MDSHTAIYNKLGELHTVIDGAREMQQWYWCVFNVSHD